MSEAQTYQSLSGAAWQEAPSVLPDAQTKRLAQHLQQAHNIPIAIAMHLARPVSYTHLTLPTNREV